MKILIGLGNPGEKYRLTRHNVGFDVIDLFCQETGIADVFHQSPCDAIAKAQKASFRHFSLIFEGQLGTEELILVKPQTFMNSSGKAVASLLSEYCVPLECLYVIYDDLNLDLGVLRIRRSGSAGGHKGVRSIINSLGNQHFPRLRIGIGEPPPHMDAIDYVLSDFSSSERKIIKQAEQTAVEALKVMITDGIEPAMNRFNIRQRDEEARSSGV